jgi:2',3'-cyclic-nucleotide 2'-phosphodiesterase (5'-nucleotidase family)
MVNILSRAALAAFLVSAIQFAFAVPAFAGGPELVIYHTNDVHGYAFEERDGEGRLVRIGYDRLKAIVDQDPAPRKLLLDAGDVLHGQSFATAKRGELIGVVLSMAGYDALAVGNHDFDYGYLRLLDISNKYRLNFLAANITGKNGQPLLPPYLMRSWGDFKVGIFGLTTPMTKRATDPRNVADLDIKDPVAEAKAAVKSLKDEGADFIVAVTHVGSEAYCEPMSQLIAKSVPGIDVVIDGHSHSKISVPIERSDGSRSLVASTGSYFENIGRIEVDKSDGGGYSVSASLIPAASPEIESAVPDPAMRGAMDSLNAELASELNQVVMKAPFDIDGSRQTVRRSSTNFGRLLCASIRDATGADAAMLNGGSIRDSFAKGDVTKGQFISALPYGNYVYAITITGEDLLAALNYGLGQPGSGAFPQFWGMEVETSKREVSAPDGTKSEALAAKTVTVGGKPLDANMEYTLAITDFMHSGGDGYLMFEKYPYREFSTLENIFNAYMSKLDPAELQAVSDATVMR